jgi:hypothetical protein
MVRRRMIFAFVRFSKSSGAHLVAQGDRERVLFVGTIEGHES